MGVPDARAVDCQCGLNAEMLPANFSDRFGFGTRRSPHEMRAFRWMRIFVTSEGLLVLPVVVQTGVDESRERHSSCLGTFGLFIRSPRWVRAKAFEDPLL